MFSFTYTKYTSDSFLTLSPNILNNWYRFLLFCTVLFGKQLFHGPYTCVFQLTMRRLWRWASSAPPSRICWPSNGWNAKNPRSRNCRPKWWWSSPCSASCSCSAKTTIVTSKFVSLNQLLLFTNLISIVGTCLINFCSRWSPGSLELSACANQQEQLQLGFWDAHVPGLHLRVDNRRTGIAWTLYQRAQRRLDQPNARNLDWILPGIVAEMLTVDHFRFRPN